MLPEGEDLNEWIAVNSECVCVRACVRTSFLLTVPIYVSVGDCGHFGLYVPLVCVIGLTFNIAFISVHCCSGGLLQPDQHAVWHHHRVLH